MNNAVANIEIGATTNRLARGLATARRAFAAFAVNAARGVSSAFGRIKLGETGSRALGAFGGSLMSKGFDALTDGAQSVRDFERDLIRFQITTNGTAQTTAALRAQVRAISNDTAIAGDQVLAGAAQYVALTGDAEGASQAMSSFARIAQASGSSVQDVASATAALRISMGLQASDIENVFSGMIVQGKSGAVELKDMAGELAALAPQFAQFRGAKSTAGIAELGAALQVVRTGAGSASMAATNLRALMSSIADPETVRKLEKLKIKIFDKDPATGVKTMRSATDIIEDLARNQKLLDPKIMATVFGREESRAALRSLQGHIDMFGQLKDAAKDTGAVQRDLNTLLESDAGRIDKAMNSLKVTIAEAFTPERIAAFADMLETATAKAGPLLDALGTAGDILGGITGVGRSVRDLIDPANPFEAELRGRRAAGQGGIGGWTGPTAEFAATQRKAAGWEQATKSIMGAEKNGRVSPASLRQAYVLAKSNAGDSGESIAAQAYLNAAKANTAEIKAAWIKEVNDANQKGLKMIADAIKNMNLEVGKSEVVVAHQKSAKHARGVAR